MNRSFALALTFLCATGLPASSTKKNPPETDFSQFQKKLNKDQQILHALDRLTFGPKPGDLEAVKKLGLKKWLDLQLHPERLPENPELTKKLDPLESLRMSQEDMVRAYPPPQLIRAVAAGRQPLPEDPVARAAVERQIKRIKVKKDQPDDQQMEPVIPLDKLLSADQIKTLRSGTPDQKRDVMATIPADKLDDIVVALQPPMRNQLMNIAPVEIRRRLMLANQPQQVVNTDLMEAKLFRAILSTHQLEEEMVDFWYNHFNVFLDKGADRFMVTSYERDIIRPRVFGKFRQLLEATASSPAMLFYLDNWQSVAPDQVRRPNGKKPVRGLNENYARELMELHTLGVDGGYTQKDIIEVARCFTGWTIRNPQQGGEFMFNERTHDKGEKVVLGVTIPAGGGKEDAEKVLDILTKHPSTARFISTKLAKRFVADTPPPALIERMAKAFRESDGDIRVVMKAMLDSKEFFSAGAFRAKVKTPLEMVASSVRATGAELDYAFALSNQLQQLGQPLYRKQEPTGYSSANAEWVNSAALLGRMNFALALVNNRVPGVKLDSTRFDSDPARAAKQMLFTDASAATLDSIRKAMTEQMAQMPKTPNPNAPTSAAMVAGLVLGSPEFQRR
jgi:uncharacterized protein (DUF1800 family)